MKLTYSAFIIASLCSATTGLAPNSWQKRLDKALLDIDGARNPQSRFRLIQRALNDKKFRYDVTRGVNAIRKRGFGKGHPKLIEALWPEGTIAREDLEGIQALIKTLPERGEELRSSDTSILKAIQATTDGLQSQMVVTNLFQQAFEERERAVTIAQNAFRRNPKEVDILKSKKIAVIEGSNDATVEIRKFDDYTAASVELSSFEDFTLTNMGEGLAKLSSYVLGYNEDEQVSEMTAPFIMQNSKMWIKRPENMYGVEPKDASVQIEEREGEIYAILEFPGICTNAEVARRKEILEEALKDQNYSITGNTMIIMQYNAPGTLPWRRKNQIGLPVKETKLENMADEVTNEEPNEVTDEVVAEQTETEGKDATEDESAEEDVIDSESEDTPTEEASSTEEEKEKPSDNIVEEE